MTFSAIIGIDAAEHHRGHHECGSAAGTVVVGEFEGSASLPCGIDLDQAEVQHLSEVKHGSCFADTFAHDAQRPPAEGRAWGLANIQRRLVKLYGAENRFKFRARRSAYRCNAVLN